MARKIVQSTPCSLLSILPLGILQLTLPSSTTRSMLLSLLCLRRQPMRLWASRCSQCSDCVSVNCACPKARAKLSCRLWGEPERCNINLSPLLFAMLRIRHCRSDARNTNLSNTHVVSCQFTHQYSARNFAQRQEADRKASQGLLHRTFINSSWRAPTIHSLYLFQMLTASFIVFCCFVRL